MKQGQVIAPNRCSPPASIRRLVAPGFERLIHPCTPFGLRIGRLVYTDEPEITVKIEERSEDMPSTQTIITIVKGAAKRFSSNDMSTHAAALSYATLFAIFPFLLFLIALLGTLNIPEFFDWLLDQARTTMPSDAYGLFSDAISQIQGRARGGLLSVGIIAALWGAASGVRSLMNSLNVAFDVEETRALWLRYALSIGYTVGLAALFIASAALMLLGPELMEKLAGAAGWSEAFVTAWNLLRWPLLGLLLAVVLGLIYRQLPDTSLTIHDIIPGALVAVAGWLIASAAFGFYVNSFGNYSATYGSLGGIIVLLLFFYLSSLIVLFGAEVNAEVRRQRTFHEPPTAIPSQAPDTHS